jgi:hypothetical protein
MPVLAHWFGSRQRSERLGEKMIELHACGNLRISLGKATHLGYTHYA